jgi:hypothetical protein
MRLKIASAKNRTHQGKKDKGRGTQNPRQKAKGCYGGGAKATDSTYLSSDKENFSGPLIHSGR